MPAARGIAIAMAAALVLTSQPAFSQPKGGPNGGLPVIRDAEIEQLMRDYTAPILKTAGLAQQNVQVVLINERAFNAFVMDGRRIFINVGALYDAKTPNEIIGVLAHETGHMAGGHLSRLREQLANAQTAAIIATLLGVGAMVGGATTGGAAGANIGQAAPAILQAPQEMIRRSLLSYVRAQEEAADRAGVKFLNATQQSAKGMYVTFKRFADDQLIISSRMDPYQQTHPMPRERMAMLDDLIKTNSYWDKTDSPELQQRHDLMRAKLSGFLDRPDTVARRYPSTDTSLQARYARAISAYRTSNLSSALTQIDALIQSQPSNPYFHELKGQALLESAHPAEAIAPLRRAAALAPNATLIRIMLGQALIATGENKHSDEAIPLLRVAMQKESEMPEVYSQLAMAYGRKGDLADADLASAQAALARGDQKTARELAARAKTRFPTGSPGWVKADDIVGLKEAKTSIFGTPKFTIGPVQRGGATMTGPSQ
ncbi:MAG: M48 family metalloprotease [Alphaproteobacteria bacterium]